MSFGMSPLPRPLSASLLVTEVRAHVAPGQLSLTVTFTETSRSLWFIGVKVDGVTDTEHDGRCVSATLTMNEQLRPLEVVQATVVVPFWQNEPEAGVQVTVPQ